MVIPKDDVSDARSVKRHLQSRTGVSRFRLRLVDEDGELPDDCAVVDLPADLQMVMLPFSEASAEQVLELISAATDGNVASVEEILQRPQDPNTPEFPGHWENRPPHRRATALGAASVRGHTEVVRVLLQAFADPEGYGMAVSCEGPAILLAAGRCHIEVARLLLDAGACKEAIGYWQAPATPLLAAINGQPTEDGPDDRNMEMVEFLLEAGANPSRPVERRLEPPDLLDHDARPLVAAAQGGHLDVVRLLLEGSFAGDAAPVQGARLTAHKHLAPALVAASAAGHVDLIRLLVEVAPPRLDACHRAMPKRFSSGARMNVDTPLFSAAYFEHVGIVSLLLRARADKDAVCGEDGLTALSAAASEGHVETVRLLLQSTRHSED